MPKPPFILLAATMASGLLALSFGCGSTASTRKISTQPQRDGTTLEPIEVRYTDANPGLSRDGTRIIFTSGREGITSPSLKTFKADWPAGGVPAAPTRAVATDIGIETEAAISPDGLWIVVKSVQNNRTDLYLVDYAGSLAPLKMTDDASVESRVVFSPDAKLISWVQRSADSEAQSAWLMDVGDGTATAVASRVKISADGAVIRDAFFVPADTGYALVTATQESSSSRVTYASRAFAATTDAGAAASTTLVTGVLFAPSVKAFVTATKVVLGQRILPATTKVAPADGPLKPLRLVNTNYVTTEPVFLPVAGGPLQSYVEPPGIDVLATALASDGETAFLLERNSLRCTEEEAYRWGTTLALAPATPPSDRPPPIINEDGTEDQVKFDVVTDRIVPRYVSAEAGFELTQGVCDATRPDGTVARLDDKVQDFVLNEAATAAKFRILYVTRFSPAFDEACRLKVGDTEVYAVEADGATRTVKPVSSNVAPLEDAPRPEACAL